MPILSASLAGCRTGPTLFQPDQQPTIDRKLVEYPPNTDLKLYVDGLTAPSAIAWDNDGSLLIAEGGVGGHDVRIFGFTRDGETFDIYPPKRALPSLPIIGKDRFRVHGPIGGMVIAHGRIYVSHRDEQGKGMITAFGYDGSRTTIIADLPAQGDFSVTDISVAPDGRLFFGMGTATNSGVVGLDNIHWLRDHREFCDQPWTTLYLLGRRFDTPNPFAGLFGGTDIAVTAPFLPFGESKETRIPPARNAKPNGAIYSVDPLGGDLRVEAHGIRYPVGLGFSEPGVLYFTNRGMKLRGTRPVKDDPDVLLRWVPGQWYGWPDFSANLRPIREAHFQSPPEVLRRTGYTDLSFLIDHETSGLAPPNPQANLLMAEFLPLSGAAKFDFAPSSGPFSRLRQAGNVAIVALFGDRHPFDTSALRGTSSLQFAGPIGYKIVQVNVDDRQVKDYVRNTHEGPASSRDNRLGLERPIDVKFGPDGAMYIVDFGQMKMKQGQEAVEGGTGRIYRLVGLEER